ncbi:cytosolic phospholipase A2-like [Centruroides vittatus]|uniref:cytosolic phospholipase A2-like n=1 Tax=Centruroides vittatus TaxID=120091 RepID=UPI0035101812
MTDEIYGPVCCDPFQIFTVYPEPFQVLTVTVLEGKNVTKGRFGDLMDTPDPYIILRVPGTPNGKKRTEMFSNTINPVWNETFNFILDPGRENILEVILMDSNYTVDEKLGVQTINIKELEINNEETFTLTYIEPTEITIKVLLVIDQKPDLRFSLTLPEKEKSFMKKRKKFVMEKLKILLKERGPQNEKEVPTIGLLGSGGGFRAMTALSGVFKALSDTGILDCITYVAGLSGSAWYISTLYSHPDFPEKSPGDLQEELKCNISQSPFWLLGPRSLYRYLTNILAKRRRGQPISFTDFFGHLLGDTLLKERTDCCLSHQQTKIEDGQLPMPFYTCLHVKSNVSARVFQEWLEFSPYEIGIAKYGTFMKTEHFGCKFYKGRIVKKYEECPLHYLQGVWGSAFCILFKRLIQDKTRLSLLLGNNSSEEKDEYPEPGMEEEQLRCTAENMCFEESEEENDTGNSSDSDCESDKENETSLTKQVQKSFWQQFIDNVCTSSVLDTRKGRAGLILNPLRGLSLVNCFPFSPFSPTSPSDDELFKGLKELIPTTTKTLYLVDGGLTFNFPFPLLQRPQRGVTFYLAFDFSSREDENIPCFKELLLSECWARANHCPFPPISELIVQYKDQPLQECYIFKHPTDTNCPTILYFPLVNSSFREFKEPGILRETEEEKEFADFHIFGNSKESFSIYNFKYTYRQFERISKLMEYNVLNNKEVIINSIEEEICRCRSQGGKLAFSFPLQKRFPEMPLNNVKV